jgi:ATP-dependent exoDNAse (exonuclease V) alpha subunit
MKYKNSQKLTVKKGELKLFNICVVKQYSDCGKIRDEILNSIEEKISGKNKTITGAPGTGKTYNMKQNPKIYTVCGTVTNMCRINMDKNAQTLYSMLSQHPSVSGREGKIRNKLRGERIWIDEFSMVPRKFWNWIFYSCMFNGSMVILTGDINQIPPIGEKKLNMKNNIVKLFMGKFETLTKDYRNDEGLIQLRDKVNAGIKAYTISDVPYTDCTNHIVYTHVQRKYINLQILKHRNETFEFVDGKLNASIGMKIKSRVNNKKLDIYKNEMYKITAKNDKTYTIENVFYKQTKKIDIIDMKIFDIGYANTYHSTQGLTFNDTFCLHQADRVYIKDFSILYTGITRGVKISDLRIYNQEHTHKDDEKECKECTYQLPEVRDA